jgi:ribosome-associated protein
MERAHIPFHTQVKNLPVEAEGWATLQNAVRALVEKKASHIMVLDVRGLSPLTQFLVVAEGNVERHCQTLAREVVDLASERGQPVVHKEGLQEGGWILLELPDVMVHVMQPSWRAFYQLERMWPQAALIAVADILG